MKSILKFPFEIFLFSLFIGIFIRQYFWHFNGFLVWILSFLLSSIITIYFYNKKIYSYENKKVSKYFALFLVLPLTSLYLFRFAFPDGSWDIINYHFINGERSINGFPFIDGDFFYLAYSNPVSDMLTTLFRHSLGHRLGTVINLLILIWSALIINRILQNIVLSHSIRSFLIFGILSFEGVIYEISNYWVDLMAIPLILTVVYFLGFVIHKTKYQYYFCALTMGMAVGFKLTNLYFIFPAVLILSYQYFINSDRKSIFAYLNYIGFIAIFLFPLIPFHSYIFFETGNPIFPHYNWIFQSPYATLSKISDATLGPSSVIESYFWPALMLFKSERLSPTPMFPIVTAFIYLLSWPLICISLFKKNILPGNLKIVLIFFTASSFLWGFISGDFRFVTVLEIISCMIFIIIFYSISNYFSIFKNKKFEFLEFFIVALCLIKITFSVNKILQYEWAGRPSLISNFSEYLLEAKYVFRDYSLYKFLPEKSKNAIDKVEVWVSSSPVVSGYMVMLNPNIPYLDLHHLPMRGRDGVVKFQNTLKSLGFKRFFSLINVGTLGLSLEWSLEELMKQGLIPIQITDLEVPFFSYSHEYLYNFKLVEVMPKEYESRMMLGRSLFEIQQMNSTLLLGEWVDGCSPKERAARETWQWCGSSATLRFKNFSNKDMTVKFRFNLQIEPTPSANILIQGKGFSESVMTTKSEIWLEETFKISAGESYPITIYTTTSRFNAPGDPRALYMKISEFSYKTIYDNDK